MIFLPFAHVQRILFFLDSSSLDHLLRIPQKPKSVEQLQLFGSLYVTSNCNVSKEILRNVSKSGHYILWQPPPLGSAPPASTSHTYTLLLSGNTKTQSHLPLPSRAQCFSINNPKGYFLVSWCLVMSPIWSTLAEPRQD